MVRQAVINAVPPERKTPARMSPVMTDEVKAFIDKILKDDLKARRKQRHTARRIWQRVPDELGWALYAPLSVELRPSVDHAAPPTLIM